MDHVWTAGCAVYAYTQRGYGVYGQMLLLLMLASRSRTWWCGWRDVKVLPRSVGEPCCGSIASHRPLFDFARPTLIATWAVNCPMFVSMRSSRLAVKRCPFAVWLTLCLTLTRVRIRSVLYSRLFRRAYRFHRVHRNYFHLWSLHKSSSRRLHDCMDVAALMRVSNEVE